MISKISHIFLITCLLCIAGCDSQESSSSPKIMVDKQLQALEKAKALKNTIADIEKKKQEQME